jgi:hypothetical protein
MLRVGIKRGFWIGVESLASGFEFFEGRAWFSKNSRVILE